MRFTPELLCKVNPTYRLNKLKFALQNKEDLLTYSKCKMCQMIYCENEWDDLALMRVYEGAIGHKKSMEKLLSVKKKMMYARVWINILRILNSLNIEKIENLKIIDYGCGWGGFQDVAHGFGVEILGFETDNIKIDFLLKRKHKIAKDINGLKSFGRSDVFVMLSVLEHVQNVDFLFDLIKKVLKPRGLLVFSVMDFRSRFIEKNIIRLRNNLPPATKNLNPIEHVNIYNYNAVITTLKKYDFSLISTGHVLRITDFFFERNRIHAINFFNKIEGLSAKIIKRKLLGITVYALNQI